MNLFQRLSLGQRVLISVALACCLCAGIADAVAVYIKNAEIHAGLAEKARTIHNRLESGTRFVAAQGGLKNAFEMLRAKYQSPDEITEMDKTFLLNQVPIVAAMTMAKDKADGEDYDFRVFSDQPRRKENQATEEEMRIFNEFLAHPDMQEKLVDNGQAVSVYRPVRLLEKHGCLQCHGDPLKSPWGNSKDILGYPMENWADGKLHGIFVVSSRIKTDNSAAGHSGDSTKFLSIAIAIGTIFSLAMAYLFLRPSVVSLRKIAEDIDQASAQVSEASRYLASISDELSSDATIQVTCLHDTAGLVDKLRMKNLQSSTTAKDASTCSETSFSTSEKGKGVVECVAKFLSAMHSGQEKTLREIKKNSDEMRSFIRIIEEVGAKTKVIDEIVFQTKILSFNAAIEAERAGPSGRGFAVVAEEMGELARMSGSAAKEMDALLRKSIEKVHHMVNNSIVEVGSLLTEGSENIESGSRLAAESIQAMASIISSASQAKAMTEEIALLSEEQVISLEAVSSSMLKIDALAAQGAARSEEAASSSSELSAQAIRMKDSITSMMEVINGRRLPK